MYPNLKSQCDTSTPIHVLLYDRNMARKSSRLTFTRIATWQRQQKTPSSWGTSIVLKSLKVRPTWSTPPQYHSNKIHAASNSSNFNLHLLSSTINPPVFSPTSSSYLQWLGMEMEKRSSISKILKLPQCITPVSSVWSSMERMRFQVAFEHPTPIAMC